MFHDVHETLMPDTEISEELVDEGFTNHVVLADDRPFVNALWCVEAIVGVSVDFVAFGLVH